MKNILGNIFGYCAKAGTSFIKLIKRAVLSIRTVFIKTPKASRQRTNYDGKNNVSVTSVRYSRKPRKLWQDKRILIAGGVVVIAVALVLIFAIPTAPNEALASIGDGMAKDVAQSTAQSAGPDASSSQSVPAVTEGESPSVTDNGMTVQNMDEPSASQSPELSPIPTTAPDKTELVPGVHDPQMIDIQQRLMDLDYMDDDEPTDYYGNGTKYALQLFQRKNDLQVDGLLGERTLTSLFAGDALPYTVKLGDRGSDVKAMQERLQELKYLKAGRTGYFGTDTEKAVKSFQKHNGLSADGNVGEYTREVLFSEDAKAAKTTTGGGNSGGGSSGGNTGGGTTIAVGDPNQASVDKLIEIAKSKLGCEYTRAGKGPNEFDCSGFVYYCLNTAGYSFKYMTSSGWAKCGLPKVTNMADMKKGDIICFRGHVGIYMGDGQMIDAGSSSDSVRICNVNSKYWVRNFICARRVF